MNKIIAKLLSRENISIVEGNFSTASFDVKHRILRVPNWSFDSKDLYDLFIGHEVGHALYTTVEGIHDAREIIPGVPFSYLNVVEDCRIEKLIRRDFPGLVPAFKRAYANLLQRNFFGQNIQERINTMSLIDRINVKSKLGHLIEVEFDEAEQKLFDMCMATETFNDVIEAIKAILEHEQANASDEPAQQENQADIPESNEEAKNSDEEEQDSINAPQSESQENEIEQPSIEEVVEEQDDLASGQDDIAQSSNENNESEKQTEAAPEPANVPRSETDEEYRKNEEQLIAESIAKEIMINVPDEAIEHCVFSYEKLAHARKVTNEHNYKMLTENFPISGFKEYMAKVKKSISPAINQFNMAKSADQSARAKINKTGSIDTSRIWSYKVNEDIFKSVINTPDAKNHGLFFLLDNSASMYDNIPAVIDQIIHLVSFAKAVDIPFEVYSFTSQRDYQTDFNVKEGEIYPTAAVVNLTSSLLKKTDFEESLYGLYLRMMAYLKMPNSHYLFPMLERMSSTPFVESIVVLQPELEKFIKKVQKATFVALLDGDTHRIEYKEQPHIQQIPWNERNNLNRIVSIKGRKISIGNELRNTNKRKIIMETGVKALGYNTACVYVGPAKQNKVFATVYTEIANGSYVEAQNVKKFVINSCKNSGCAIFDNAFGFDVLYFVDDSSLNTRSDDEGIASAQTPTQLRSKFIKEQSTKKKGKILLAHFGKFVA